jgi:hypothetical protein
MLQVPIAATAEAPKKLMVIETFAGSHPVGRHFQHLQTQQQQQQQSTVPYRLAAYAAVESHRPVGEKYRAPQAEALGLTPFHHLSLRARVEDPAAHSQLVKFVRDELRSSGLDGVVVFGGPPCKKFSQAGSLAEKRQKSLNTAQNRTLQAAQSGLEQLDQSQAAGDAVSAAAVAEAEQLVAAARRVREAAADAVVQHELDVQAAEAMVSSFLKLFQDIKKECRGSGNVPCHLVMENPYSSAKKALWNR